MINYSIRSTAHFMGYPNPQWAQAKAVLLPIPYDGTTSYQSGTRFGPEAMLAASTQLELYDEEFGFETISRLPVYTLDPMEPHLNHPGDMIAAVRQATAQIYRAKKFPLLFGGEHSLTFGAVQAAYQYHKKFSVLHLDAHADFRNEYEHTRFNHACVMRRSIEVAQAVTSVGLRSIGRADMIEHKKYKKRHHWFLAPAVPLEQIIATLGSKVYITVDIDVLDASIMPATGTPLPGGLGWYDVLAVIKAVGQQRQVIGADIMEFMPIGGLRAPDILAAKLLYKMLGYCLKPQAK
ncbi:MAG: agmatinase [Candidatus Kerfeldbacteria bacterium]|nr:agmatinase [Candidatus Kerfeldbacteria bacterium]